MKLKFYIIVIFSIKISTDAKLQSIDHISPSVGLFDRKRSQWDVQFQETTNCSNTVDRGFPFESYEDRLKEYASSRVKEWYLPVADRENPKCHKDLWIWKSAIEEGEPWALRMVDSWGKSSDGILYNNYETPGSYDECLGVTYDKESQFVGKYCTIYFFPPRNPIKPWPVGSEGYVQELKSRLGVLSGYDSNSVLTYRTYGTCIPNSCSQGELAKAIVDTLSVHNHTLMRVDCHANSDSLKLDLPDYLFLSYVVLIAILMISASILRSFDEDKYSSDFAYFIRAFDPKTNLYKVFKVDHNTVDGNSIACLNGIRVISTIAVVLCHQCGMSVHSSNIMKLYEENKMGLPFISVMISVASLSVDSFLFISGLLLSWSSLKKISSPKKFNLVDYYAFRFLRLAPAIAVSCFFFATWARHLISGPWSSEFQLITNACRKFWWKDVFFLFNFFPWSNGRDSFPACMGQCWYTAVDTQLYFVAPLILLPLISSTSKGIKILVVSTIAAIIIPSLEVLFRELPPTNILGLGNRSNVEFYQILYVMPWNRAGPWLVGIWTGLLLNKSSRDEGQAGKRKLKFLIGWTVSVLVAIYIIKTMVDMNMHKDDYFAMNETFKAVFGGLHRTAWATSLAFVVYACQMGYGGFVNDFLSYPGFQPMSKLTFSVFLLSLNIQFALAWSAKQQPYFSYFNKVLETCGALFLSLVGGILLNLCTESPSANILNLSLAKRKRKSERLKND